MGQLSMSKREIFNICASALDNNDTLDLALQACQGLFPNKSVEIFRQIDKNKTAQIINDAWGSKTFPHLSDEQDSFFVSTWRFTPDSARKIFDALPTCGSNFLLLGAPTLLQKDIHLCKSNSCLLIDIVAPPKNPSDVPTLQYDIGNLSGKEFPCEFDMCFLDPPWYLNPLKHWISVASNSVRDGGIVAFPLLQSLTRPTAAKDRDIVFEYLEEVGLHADLWKDFVLYQPPSFERAILRRSGLPPVCWKRADLVVCKKRSNGIFNDNLEGVVMPPFKQVRVGAVGLDIVFDRYDRQSDDVLSWNGKEYWMSSPSRRDKFNYSCNVFTSNGARFVSPKPLELFEFLSASGEENVEKLRSLFPDDFVMECLVR